MTNTVLQMATCGLLKHIIALESSCESHSKCAFQIPTSQAKSTASSSALTLGIFGIKLLA